MNDKTLLFCLPAILCAPLFGAHASGKETPKDDGERTGRPNVLFLLTDDQTFNTIRACIHPHIPSFLSSLRNSPGVRDLYFCKAYNRVDSRCYMHKDL